MGELILCKTPMAARSYYIEESALNIYSLEELSFYIYENAFMLDSGLINDSLCDWIDHELKEDMLARELRTFLENEASINVLVGHLLRHVGYLTRDEIKRTLDVIASFEGKSQAQIEKIRSDYLMSNKRYLDAVRSYESILDKKLEMDDTLKGDIMHNLACALSSLFLFKRAGSYFEQAYRLNRKEESLFMMLYACLFDSDYERFNQYADRYQVLPERIENLKQTYNNAMNSEKNKAFHTAFNNKLSLASNFLEREDVYKDYLESCESDYNSLRS